MGRGDAENFTECEDREVLVGAMVESREAVEIVETACRDADVPLGAPKHDIEAAAAVLDAEYRVLRMGDEFGAVRDILGDRIDALG